MLGLSDIQRENLMRERSETIQKQRKTRQIKNGLAIRQSQGPLAHPQGP